MSDYQQLLNEVITVQASLSSLLIDGRATRLWSTLPTLAHQSLASFALDVDRLDDLVSSLDWDHAVLSTVLPSHPLPPQRLETIEVRVQVARDVTWWLEDSLVGPAPWDTGTGSAERTLH